MPRTDWKSNNICKRCCKSLSTNWETTKRHQLCWHQNIFAICQWKLSISRWIYLFLKIWLKSYPYLSTFTFTVFLIYYLHKLQFQSIHPRENEQIESPTTAKNIIFNLYYKYANDMIIIYRKVFVVGYVPTDLPNPK